MKLLTKTTFYYILFSFILFIAGGFISYHVIYNVVYRQLDETLITEKEIIEEAIEQSDSVPDFTDRFGHQIEVIIFEKPVKSFQALHDTVIYDDKKHENIEYRHLLSKNNDSDQRGYQISILRPLDKTEYLISNFVLVIIVMFIFLMLILVFANYLISKRVWIPFYNTIKKINIYNIKDTEILNFDKTGTTEFKTLNHVLEVMSVKIKKDYLNLKEYNENISHEIQTPLAIIKNKIELLMQFENLDRNQMMIIESVHQAATRLSKLIQNLNLLTGIDNQQFSNEEEVNIIEVIEKYLQNFEDIISLKKLTVTKDFNDIVILKMNASLTDVLISNLINNAIRHNIENGIIRIVLSASGLTISNTGQPLHQQPEEFFERFKKAKKDSSSFGLGLALVKKISDLYNFRAEYLYKDNIHTLKIIF